MKDFYLYDILVSPMFSEKAVAGNEFGKYVFKVSCESTKHTIKSAIKKLFGVNVQKVRIVSMPKKAKKFKGLQGIRSGFKKAVVTLDSGSVINLSGI